MYFSPRTQHDAEHTVGNLQILQNELNKKQGSGVGTGEDTILSSASPGGIPSFAWQDSSWADFADFPVQCSSLYQGQNIYT